MAQNSKKSINWSSTINRLIGASLVMKEYIQLLKSILKLFYWFFMLACQFNNIRLFNACALYSKPANCGSGNRLDAAGVGRINASALSFTLFPMFLFFRLSLAQSSRLRLPQSDTVRQKLAQAAVKEYFNMCTWRFCGRGAFVSAAASRRDGAGLNLGG